MKRCLFFLMALLLFFVSSPAFGAEAKKPSPKAKPAQETKSPETTYHALIIGNNQYKYLPKLKTARNDAVEVEKLLKEKLGFQTEILLDATRANILGKINEMRKRLGEKDSLLIYYAGHGEFDKNVDKAYWLPVDAQRDDPTNWIIADDITSNIKRITARHVLVVSDSCYSGTLGRQAVTELISTGGREGYLKKMQERPSRTLMASGGNEPVSDSGGGNNSIFAAAFLTALKESDKANFTAEEVFHGRIKPIVAGKSDQVPEYSSIKNSGDEGGDFVFRLAKMDVEPPKTAMDIKVQSQEEDKQLEKEHKKIDEERRRLEVEKAQLEKDRKRVEQEQKLAEERQRLEAEKQRLEEEKQAALAEQKKKKPEVSTAMAPQPSQRPDETSTRITNSIGMEFVLIPAGSFMMGGGEGPENLPKKIAYGGKPGKTELFQPKHPQHRVTITKPFFLQKTEVTVEQFRRFADDSGYQTDAEREGWGMVRDHDQDRWTRKDGANWKAPGFSQGSKEPVTMVSWNDAEAFIAWLNKKEGTDKYRLPTEAEWEYSCRAGTDTPFYWGKNPSEKYANFADATLAEAYPKEPYVNKNVQDGYVHTAPVGSFLPNAFGLFDMSGNVGEWVKDRYGDYPSGSVTDPTGPSSGNGRVVRGGSWCGDTRFIRSDIRLSRDPVNRSYVLGFRVARDY